MTAKICPFPPRRNVQLTGLFFRMPTHWQRRRIADMVLRARVPLPLTATLTHRTVEQVRAALMQPPRVP